MTSRFLIADAKREEGCRLTAYRDTLGTLTIGYGHTGADVHEGETWTPDQADVAIRSDMNMAVSGLRADLPWWSRLDDNRQDVLALMAFQMGVSGVLKFSKTLEAVSRHDYQRATDAMLDSAWAKQTPARAARMSAQMRSGQRAWAYMDGK